MLISLSFLIIFTILVILSFINIYLFSWNFKNIIFNHLHFGSKFLNYTGIFQYWFTGNHQYLSNLHFHEIIALNILPLFIISIIHYIYLTNCFNLFKVKKQKQRIILIILFSIFFCLTSGSFILFKTILTYILFGFKNKIWDISKHALIGIICIFIYSSQLCISLGFIYSFTITFFCEIFKKITWKDIKFWQWQIYIFLVSFPINCYINHKFSFLNIIITSIAYYPILTIWLISIPIIFIPNINWFLNDVNKLIWILIDFTYYHIKFYWINISLEIILIYYIIFIIFHLLFWLRKKSFFREISIRVKY